MKLAWPDLLDALEERTRRCAALAEAGGAGDAVPDLDLSADGPPPPELALRLQTLLAETARVQALLEQRTRQASTALRYGQV